MPAIRPELLDELLKDYQKPEDLLGQDGLLQQLTKALFERALSGELTHRLVYEKHSPAGYNSGNSRNGTTPCICPRMDIILFSRAWVMMRHEAYLTSPYANPIARSKTSPMTVQVPLQKMPRCN